MLKSEAAMTAATWGTDIAFAKRSFIACAPQAALARKTSPRIEGAPKPNTRPNSSGETQRSEEYMHTSVFRVKQKVFEAFMTEPRPRNFLLWVSA